MIYRIMKNGNGLIWIERKDETAWIFRRWHKEESHHISRMGRFYYQLRTFPSVAQAENWIAEQEHQAVIDKTYKQGQKSLVEVKRFPPNIARKCV